MGSVAIEVGESRFVTAPSLRRRIRKVRVDTDRAGVYLRGLREATLRSLVHTVPPRPRPPPEVVRDLDRGIVSGVGNH